MKKSRAMFIIMGAIVLLMGGLLMFAIKQGNATSPPTNSQSDNRDSAVNRIPSGAKFPVCWSAKFSELPALAVGKEVEITITIGAPLFDMKEVEFIPKTGKDLLLVSGEKWKGALKKGSSHVVKLVVKPTQKGLYGIYGVLVKAPHFYAEVAAYVQAQKDGPYGNASAKMSVLDQINGMRSAHPNYEEWFGSTIEIKTTGGN